MVGAQHRMHDLLQPLDGTVNTLVCPLVCPLKGGISSVTGDAARGRARDAVPDARTQGRAPHDAALDHDLNRRGHHRPAIVDIVRHHYPLSTTVGWIALVIVLPLLGRSSDHTASRIPGKLSGRTAAGGAHDNRWSIFLIAFGAILRYAVADASSVVDVPTVGLILMIVGVLGLILGIFQMSAARRRGNLPPPPPY